MAIVEFALLAPTAFVLLMGLLVLGLVVANQNLLTDGVRDTARAAGVCGGSNRPVDPATAISVTQLPPPPGSSTATPCSWANLATYAGRRLAVLAGGGALSAPAGDTNCSVLAGGSALACLYVQNGSPAPALAAGHNPLDDCQAGWKIGISSKEAQPLYVPLIGHFLGNGGTNTRSITADAEATCEQ